ncbi:macrophage mannose receptor 1 isoform X2 [Oryzias melastigma]|nr:macrophage mannose receptor 1 isoform X2 [Oryzias melastigma]XP_036071952.1 macrophage mannose receptor 1 isoform X2 [Oryzias melastigma]
MDHWRTLLFFGFSLSCCSKVPLRQYHYVDSVLSWYEAQQYCRENFTDLATFESLDDISRLQPTFAHKQAWIGLWDDPNAWKTSMGNQSNSWRWSVTEETTTTGYQAWSYPNLDFYGGLESCGMMRSGGSWGDYNCAAALRFLCYNVTEQNQKVYFYIEETMAWSSAQQYCRSHFLDLATIENEAENTDANNHRSSSALVWFGLYREPWTWSDQSHSPFRNNNPAGLTNPSGGHCVLEDTETHLWDNQDCSVETGFICHQVSRLRTTFKVKILSEVDLSDPKVNAQILWQLSDLLAEDGWTDFNLQWTVELQQSPE